MFIMRLQKVLFEKFWVFPFYKNRKKSLTKHERGNKNNDYLTESYKFLLIIK